MIEQWFCFRCCKNYDKPEYGKAHSESGTPTRLYYCDDCCKIIFKGLKEFNK